VDLPVYTGQEGQWQITAKEIDPPFGDGGTHAAVTHVLDKPALIPLVENVQFSDRSVTPTITWDEVRFTDHLGVDRAVDYYEVRIEKSGVLDVLHECDLLREPRYQVPISEIPVGERVWVRITAKHFDPQPGEGPGDPDGPSPTSNFWVENQSRTWVPFTAVPEPGTVVLAMVALLGLMAASSRGIGNHGMR